MQAWLRSQLLSWFARHQRKLPWRSPKEDQLAPAYHVWVSEVMLQQTRVQVVRDYFTRFIERFPSIEALSQAEEADVLQLWQGLGYYSRARRLHAGARYLVERHQGELPEAVDELLKVPGVGPYSAGAISSIAYGHAAPIVDGNVIRVLARVYGMEGDPTKGRVNKEIWELARELVQELRPRQPARLNQALMELGALVCTPRSPSCTSCPWAGKCVAFASGRTDSLPALPPPKKKTSVTLGLVIAQQGAAIALVDYPNDARWWGGLTGLPYFERAGTFQPEELREASLEFALTHLAREAELGELLPPIRHVVTRFSIEAHPVMIDVMNGREQGSPLAYRLARKGGSEPAPRLRWLRREELGQVALPSPHKRLLNRLF